MTPIPFDLPSTRTLPPTVAYAAGLVCELRPDLADGVRSAVFGDAALTALGVLTLARVEARDKQGSAALGCLRDLVYYGGNAPTALHGLADVLGLLPWSTAKFDGERWNNGTAWWRQTKDDPWSRIQWRPDDIVFESPPAADTLFGHVPIGHAFWYQNGVLRVCGLPLARFQDQAMALRGSRVVWRYLHEGFAVVWAASKSDGAREALRHLVPIHAHTISLDPAERAAWAKAHLDAIDEPVRPMSPDRLN